MDLYNTSRPSETREVQNARTIHDDKKSAAFEHADVTCETIIDAMKECDQIDKATQEAIEALEALEALEAIEGVGAGEENQQSLQTDENIAAAGLMILNAKARMEHSIDVTMGIIQNPDGAMNKFCENVQRLLCACYLERLAYKNTCITTL